MIAMVLASVLAVASAAPQFIAAPIAAVPVGVTASQYHAQDELGQYSYGYAGGPSAKSEAKDAAGNVRGSYSYIDGNGLTQTVNYVADPVNGFRVAATNLPVGPAPVGQVAIAASPIVHQQVAVRSAIPTYVAASPASATNPFSTIHVAPLPVDTPEVHAAKIQHAAAHQEALIRSG